MKGRVFESHRSNHGESARRRLALIQLAAGCVPNVGAAHLAMGTLIFPAVAAA